MRNRTYLGDSVYASVEHGMIRLCTNNGIRDENVIFLELVIYHNLVIYVDEITKKETP